MLNHIFWTIRFVYKIDKINFIKKVLIQSFLSIENLLGFFIIGLIIQSLVNKEDLTPILVITFLLNLLIFTFRIMQDYSSRIIEAKYPIAINKIIFTKLNQNKVEDNESPVVQNMVNLVEEVKESPRYFLENLLLLTANIFAILVSGITVLIYTPIIIPLTIIILVPKTFLNRKFLKELHQINRDMTVERRKAYGIVKYITDANTYKESWILGSFSFFEKIFNKFSDNYLNKVTKLRINWMFLLWITRILDLALYIFGIILFADLFQKGDFQIETVSLALASMITFRSNAESINFSIVNLLEQANRTKDIRDFLEFKSQDNLKVINNNTTVSTSKVNKITLDSFERFQIEDLSFKYKGSERVVLNIPKLEIRKGEKIAIVGHNGAGKTTLIKLLTGIYNTEKDSIRINGKAMNEIDINSWIRLIAVLFQDYTTYEHLTVRENLLLGLKVGDKLDDNALWQALEMADAEFVKSYPKGLDTILSEKYDNGIRPSGGQWQKISIARYFLRNSEVLILDEPTSAIDAISEYNIFNNIYQSIKDKTVIIVSHRFSTVRKADRIIVLDQGKIVEEGNHNELIKRQGIYAKAFEKQKGGYG